jgi:hypothetical protein
VVYDPHGVSITWTMLLLWPGHCDASIVWTMCLSMLVSMVHLWMLLRHIYRPKYVVSRYELISKLLFLVVMK